MAFGGAYAPLFPALCAGVYAIAPPRSTIFPKSRLWFAMAIANWALLFYGMPRAFSAEASSPAVVYAEIIFPRGRENYQFASCPLHSFHNLKPHAVALWKCASTWLLCLISLQSISILATLQGDIVFFSAAPAKDWMRDKALNLLNAGVSLRSWSTWSISEFFRPAGQKRLSAQSCWPYFLSCWFRCFA